MIEKQAIRVLMIDDSRSDRKILRRYLQEDPDHKYLIFESETGEEGLEMCRSLKLDCLLLDYQLPDTGGLELFNIIKNDPKLKNLPVVLITGIGDEKLAVESFRRGIQDYINKENLSQVEVSRAIKNALDRIRKPLKLETDLSETEERFRLLVEGAREYAIFLLDAKGMVSFWNAGAERLTGFSAEEIMGKSISHFYSEEDVGNRIHEIDLKAAAVEGKHGGIGVRVRKDKSQYWADVLFTSLRDNSGEIRGYAKVMRDISDRIEVERALRKTELRLKRLVYSNLLGIVFWRHDGVVTEANDSFLKIVGYSRDDLNQGRINFLEFTTSDGPLFNENLLERFSRSGVTPAFERRFMRKDHTYVPVLMAAATIEDQTREHVAFVADLSENLKVREKLEKSEEAIRMRDEFISVASHELKTPITSLRLQIQGILRSFKKKTAVPYTEEKLTKILVSADLQIEKLTCLVDDLLDVARLRSGKMQYHFEEMDLSDLTLEVVERFWSEREVGSKDINFITSGPITGVLDRFRLDQVITNLLSNALKYGLGKPITIQLNQENGHVIIMVQDSGMGIALDSQERIFERFERAETTVNITGLGLGLYIVKNIVEEHGGKVSVISRLGAGSTFIIRLPLRSAGPGLIKNKTKS